MDKLKRSIVMLILSSDSVRYSLCQYFTENQ